MSEIDDQIGRLMADMPDNVEAEKYVLSVIIQRREGWDDYAVDEGMFYRSEHKNIFRLLQDEGEHIQTSLLLGKARDLGILDKIGGAAYLTDLEWFAPTFAHYPEMIQQLREYDARRMEISLAVEMVRKSRDKADRGGFLEILGESATLILERATGAESAKDKMELLRKATCEYAKRVKGESDPMGWKVSISTLSTAINGFRPSRYCVISGYPSSGKTLLAGQFLLDFAQQDIPCLFLSFEMDSEQIMERLIMTLGRFDSSLFLDPVRYAMRTRGGKPNHEDTGKVERAISKMEKLPIYFEEATSPRLSQVITMLRRAKKRHKIKAAAIDYLQLIRPDSYAQSKEQELTMISHALQAAAKEMDICLFILSQQNQAGDTKYASTTIEDADYVFSVVQEMNKEAENYREIEGLRINKDRHTGKGGWTIPIQKQENEVFFTEREMKQ